MSKTRLTIARLPEAAKLYCQEAEQLNHKELVGVTDGKAVGTHVEQSFKTFLSSRYSLTVGNAAKGLDLPGINTDIKVTSARQPQSSCPYQDCRQKVYGLGYNLLLFVYEKTDNVRQRSCRLQFTNCVVIKASRTADYQTTTGIRQILNNQGNVDDIFAYLNDRGVPGGTETLYALAEEIMRRPPSIGLLTISNALQWRLQYSRIVQLDHVEKGITSIV